MGISKGLGIGIPFSGNVAKGKYILVRADDGLHAISLETGTEIWHFAATSGMTPAVDQANGLIYFQSHKGISKLNARTGAEIKDSTVSIDGSVYSGNTVLANDGYGYRILAYRHRWMANGGRIYCYDENLTKKWLINTGLNTTIKNSLCYHGGLVYIGTGETYFSGQEEWYTGEPENCKVIAYNLSDGSVAWSTMLSDPVDKVFETAGYAVMNVIYCNGYIIAEQSSGVETCPAKIRVLNATTGEVVKTFTDSIYVTSCAGISFSNGRLVTGNLGNDKMHVYQIGTGAITDFYPFGSAQTNTMEAPDAALTALDEDITMVGQIAGGNQGSTIMNGIAYCAYGSLNKGVVAFDIDTLDIVKSYPTASSWDSTPIVLQNREGQWRILVHEYVQKRTICRRVSDASLAWYSGANQQGTAFFGYTYYEL